MGHPQLFVKILKENEKGKGSGENKLGQERDRRREKIQAPGLQQTPARQRRREATAGPHPQKRRGAAAGAGRSPLQQPAAQDRCRPGGGARGAPASPRTPAPRPAAAAAAHLESSRGSPTAGRRGGGRSWPRRGDFPGAVGGPGSSGLGLPRSRSRKARPARLDARREVTLLPPARFALRPDLLRPSLTSRL